MDYIEKYLMVRLYRLTFCSYLTDDEERDLAMQNRIRSLHWITSHLLDTALDESCDGVRDLLDAAITGQFTLPLHWLGGIMVTLSDLRSSGRGFDCQLGCYQATWINSAFHPSGVGKLSTGLAGWG